jgi:hypothetical protein
MQTIWLKGHKDNVKRRQEVLAYRNAFDALREVLEQEYKKKPAVRDYEVPNWELRQVAVNEYNQCLDDLLKLIQIDKE